MVHSKTKVWNSGVCTSHPESMPSFPAELIKEQIFWIAGVRLWTTRKIGSRFRTPSSSTIRTTAGWFKILLRLITLLIISNKNHLIGQAVNQSVTNKFEDSNILVTNIYSDIHTYQIFLYEYIRIFVCVKYICRNIFGHSWMSVLECKNLTNIRIYSNIRAIFNMNTYSDIHSCQTN